MDELQLFQGPPLPPLEVLLRNYKNTADHNDYLFKYLTELTWSDEILSTHRRYVEDNKLGFGDAAFHAMWLRLLDHVKNRFGSLRTLEIGVFKGQVISLWALVARHWNLDIEIHAITPLAGQPMPRSRLVSRIRQHFDRRFREDLLNGNFYENANYLDVISRLFDQFGLDFNRVRLYQGYSTDPPIREKLRNDTFHIIYVDGDHSFEGAKHDFTVYGQKVVKGGLLVADDAGCGLPGNAFWKGHKAVSAAASILPELGFRNVINIGHNCVYERL